MKWGQPDAATTVAAASRGEDLPTVFMVEENIICSDPALVLKKGKRYWIRNLKENRYFDQMVLIWTPDGIEIRVCWEVREDSKSRYVRDLAG